MPAVRTGRVAVGRGTVSGMVTRSVNEGSGMLRPPMMPVTTRDIDALWAPATPQFAYQIAVRVRDLIADLPEDDPVGATARQKLVELDHLGHGTTKGDETGHH